MFESGMYVKETKKSQKEGSRVQKTIYKVPTGWEVKEAKSFYIGFGSLFKGTVIRDFIIRFSNWKVPPGVLIQLLDYFR